MVQFFQGFGIGGGLIVAIGAQNSFVLTQGVKRQYFFLVPLLCSLIDVALICGGAVGVGTYVAAHPSISYYAAVGGTVYLFVFGLNSLRSALSDNTLQKMNKVDASKSKIVLTTLALSLLNPHVYIDTILMLGSLSGQFHGMLRLAFVLGACSASIVWFFSLSIGGTLLEPFFKKPLSWKILDLCVWIVMWAIAWSIWPGLSF